MDSNDIIRYNKQGYIFEINNNYKMAFQCYARACVYGDETALINVARCYQRGIGVEIDLKKANICYRLSKNNDSLR
jgi:TPR repeat protein